MTPLANDVVLGAGRVYAVIGLWTGKVKRPSPNVVRDKFTAKGFTAWFVNSEDVVTDDSRGIVGLVSSEDSGHTVVELLRVLGYQGANAGAVCESDVGIDVLMGVAIGGSIEAAVAGVSAGFKAAMDAAGDIGGIVTTLVRNWPIVLAVAVAVYLVATGKVKL